MDRCCLVTFLHIINGWLGTLASGQTVMNSIFVVLFLLFIFYLSYLFIYGFWAGIIKRKIRDTHNKSLYHTGNKAVKIGGLYMFLSLIGFAIMVTAMRFF